MKKKVRYILGVKNTKALLFLGRKKVGGDGSEHVVGIH